jgi:hypothetical protein
LEQQRTVIHVDLGRQWSFAGCEIVNICRERTLLGPGRSGRRQDVKADGERPCAGADPQLLALAQGVAQANYGMQPFIGLNHALTCVGVQGGDDVKTLLCNLPKVRQDGICDVFPMVLRWQSGSITTSDEGGEGKFADPSFTGPVEVWSKDPD